MGKHIRPATLYEKMMVVQRCFVGRSLGTEYYKKEIYPCLTDVRTFENVMVLYYDMKRMEFDHFDSVRAFHERIIRYLGRTILVATYSDPSKLVEGWFINMPVTKDTIKYHAENQVFQLAEQSIKHSMMFTNLFPDSFVVMDLAVSVQRRILNEL